MSGIAGIIHFDGQPVAPGQIEAMTGAMPYRGPDGIKHWRRGNVALGQCMLRTTPESLEETQPLANEDESVVLIMDGRVDNWEELRRELLGSGGILRTRADAELILRAYEVWGEQCLSHIDGDFALLIWDAKRQMAFCARDRVGIKPIVYHWHNNSLTVASEIGALHKTTCVPKTLNVGKIAEYLADTALSVDETFYVNCLRLLPGHFLTADARGLRLTRYWSPDAAGETVFPRYNDYAERLAEILNIAIRRRTRSHRAIGTLLSGGMDSATVACLARGATLELNLPPLHTYSLIYPNWTCNEQDSIQALLKHAGLSQQHHHEFDGTIPNLRGIEQSLTSFDIPDSPIGAAFYPLYADAAMCGSRVMLGGWGADDWLGGGSGQIADLFRFGGLRQAYRRARADSATSGLGLAIGRLLQYGIRPNIALMLRKSQLLSWALNKRNRPRKYAWLSQSMTEMLRAREERHSCAQHRVSASSFRKSQMISWLQGGMFANNAALQEVGCARHGIEGRYPFHDRLIVEFAFSLPPAIPLSDTRYKQLLHKALVHQVPALRSHKFSDPDGSPIYAAAAVSPYYLQMGLSRLISSGWIDTGATDVLQSAIRNWVETSDERRYAPHVRSLWHLLALEQWLRRN